MEECHLPGLGVALTLDYKPDTADEAVSPLVSYVSGLLLGTNSKVRTWFSMFIRNGQQVRTGARVYSVFRLMLYAHVDRLKIVMQQNAFCLIVLSRGHGLLDE